MKTETLERIENNLNDARGKSDDLRRLRREQKALLTEKIKEQSNALLQGENAAKLGDEIMKLRQGIEGLENAIKEQEKVITSMEQGKSTELNKIRLARLEQINQEALQISDEIYSLLFEAASKVEELKEKYRAYRLDLKNKDPHLLQYVQNKRSNLIVKLTDDLPRLMDFFPNEVIVKKGVTPTELKHKLRKQTN